MSTRDRPENHRLPNEIDGHSIFLITFEDGCQYYGRTSEVIFPAAQRVCGEAEPTPEQERTNTAAGHAECMNIDEIKCLETSLDEETAGQKLESLLSQLHNNAQSHHETRVMFRDNGHCWIPDHRIVNKAVAVMYGRRDRAQES